MEKIGVEDSEKTLAARAACRLLGVVMREYLRSSVYYKSIDAQTPSCEYGGSRSMAYCAMLSAAESLPGMLEARREFSTRHQETVNSEPYHDERGGLLRIAGYRLRHVPVVGPALEAQVRADDPAMISATFVYPSCLTGDPVEG